MMRNLTTHAAAFLRRTGLLAPLPERSPDFVVVGAQKSGTTSLAAWLAEHPSCWIASEKEVHYFDLAYRRGFAWYRTRFGKAPADRLAGEVTPYYLFHPLVAGRMAAALPDSKIVAILRDPVARAVSGYLHSRRYHGEARPFEQALADEDRAISEDLAQLAKDPLAPCDALQTRSYRARGLYAEQLARYFERFPRAQVHVMFFEELVSSPEPTLDTLCGFLGIAPHRSRLPWRNERAGDAREVPESTLKSLREFYREPNARLAALLGRPLPW
jgi:hypothetical protein